VSVECDHPLVPGDGRNLAARAASDLRRHARRADGVAIRIRKRIPVGGGMGGGSSNAASVLLALDRLFELGLGPGGLVPLARRLGADVPYFLFGGTALGLARGDEVYPLRRQVRGHVVLIDAGYPVSTAKVFARIDSRLTPRENGTKIFRFVSSDLEGSGLFAALSNELEEAALEEAPALQGALTSIRSLLVRAGASLTALSGSGSSYFGLFERADGARKACAALRAAGHVALRARTVPFDRYRRIWSEALGGRGRGKEPTPWRSRTSRSFP
jgi:4-diphosphocytidyl-2-C-methyl-D-erythritol kinase